MICFIIFVFGFWLGYKYSSLPSSKMHRYFKKHPLQEKVVVLLTIPISYLILYPIDSLKDGVSISEYNKTYKELLFK